MGSISGLGITTDTQLHKIGKLMGVKINYIGYAEDLHSSAPVGYNIINLGDHTIGGTHWVLWYVDPSLKYSIYCDSYGAPPEDNVVKLTPRPLFFNVKQLQGYDEEYCGIWAITLASILNKASDKKKAFDAFLRMFISVH